MSELVTVLGQWCTRCGAAPRERCRAVVRRDTGHGQEIREAHRNRHETPSFITEEAARRVRATLPDVWGSR